MNKKILFILLLVSILITGFIVYPKIQLYFSGNKTSINDTEIEFIVKKNSSLQDLAAQLYDNGIIDDQEGFISVGEYKNLSSNNIASGKYIIKPKTNYKNLLNGFTMNSRGNGNAEISVSVKFNNCRDIDDVTRQVASQLEINQESLKKTIFSTNYLEKYNIEVTEAQLPALFLPNTYNLYFDTDESEFIDKMIQEYNNFWNENRLTKLEDIGLKEPYEASTIASIVYAEQNIVSEEWPIIASVYLNRIKKGMRLESCPTVRFCDSTITGQPYADDIERNKDNPYNTYRHDGLPPGPINLPSPDVIDAVLNRTEGNYIFMCAKPDYSHTHNFASTLKEHNKNSKEVNAFYRQIRNNKAK